jgi:hypothetical protein
LPRAIWSSGCTTSSRSPGTTRSTFNHDLPRYTAMCRAHLPGYDGLSPHCKGVLFSVVLNRGASFDLQGPHYAEMRGHQGRDQEGRSRPCAGAAALDEASLAR